MRLRGLAVVGALVVVAACSDSVGPPVQGQDLEFYAPVTREASVVTESGTGTGQLPIISRTFVAGSWDDHAYVVAYGMYGGGTGYSMAPRFRYVDAEGRATEGNGRGQSEDAPLYWYMRPTNIEPFTVGFDCGGQGEATVLFEARLSTYGPTPTLLKTQKSDFARTPQQVCLQPAPAPGGGASGSGGRVTITICSYEAWLTPDGTVIAIVEMGCTSTVGETFAE